MIKLVVTDMDGTLLNSQKELPPGFIPWVASHPQVRVVIASGRQYATLYEQFGKVRDRLIYLAENGGLVFDQGEVIYQNVLSKEEGKACLDSVEGLPGVTPILCGVKSANMRRASELVEAQGRMYYRQLQFLEEPASCLSFDALIKLALYVEGGRAAEIPGQLRGLPDSVAPVVSGADWVDLGGRFVNKGAALRAIQKRYGIAREETLGFGDYMNDYEMLKNCGESYAMANACQEIKAVASREAPSNEEQGVMQVLNELEAVL